MAFTKISLLLPLLTTFLFFHSQSASVTVRISNTMLIAICRQTQNFDFCITTLENYPLIDQVDMNNLAAISVTLATEQARLNKAIIDVYYKKEKDDEMKNRFANCQGDYELALFNLNFASLLSNVKDYKDMKGLMKSAMNMINKCENRLRNTYPFIDYYKKMVLLNDIAIVILDILDG